MGMSTDEGVVNATHEVEKLAAESGRMKASNKRPEDVIPEEIQRLRAAERLVSLVSSLMASVSKKAAKLQSMCDTTCSAMSVEALRLQELQSRCNEMDEVQMSLMRQADHAMSMLRSVIVSRIADHVEMSTVWPTISAVSQLRNGLNHNIMTRVSKNKAEKQSGPSVEYIRERLTEHEQIIGSLQKRISALKGVV